MKIEYYPAVEVELKEIRNYYEAQSPGLGEQFLDEFEKHVEVLAEEPKRWKVVAGEIRRSLMRRFPYVIYFRPILPVGIRITIVKHQRRHPSLGLKRD